MWHAALTANGCNLPEGEQISELFSADFLFQNTNTKKRAIINFPAVFFYRSET